MMVDSTGDRPALEAAQVSRVWNSSGWAEI